MYIKSFGIAYMLEDAQNRIHSSGVGHKANIQIALEILMSPPVISNLSNPPAHIRTAILRAKALMFFKTKEMVHWIILLPAMPNSSSVSYCVKREPTVL